MKASLIDHVQNVVLFAVVMLGLAGCGAESESTPVPDVPGSALSLDRPNILWLVTEDLGFQLPSFGDSTIATPNLSRLADEGVRYPHVYSPSGVCAPSRAAIATGMYPTAIGAQHMRTGPWYNGAAPPNVVAAAAEAMPEGVLPYEAQPPPEVRMHAEYLRKLGYYTSNNRKEDYQFIKPVTAWDDSSPGAHWRNRAPGQPFFSIFNFNVTHESRIWMKADDPLLVPESLAVPVPPYLPDTEVVRRDLRRMYSNILEMDAEVGALLRELETDGLLDSTIVFWYSDNGGPMPRQKRLLYDAGIRIPMIIRFPGADEAGTEDDQLISFIDFLPSLLSVAGVEPPEYLHGRAFLGNFAEEEQRRYIHAAADRLDDQYDRIRAVKDHRYKYLRNLLPDQGYYLPLAYREQMPTMQELLRLRDEGTLEPEDAQWFRSEKPVEELFDTWQDPHEIHNLALDPGYENVLQELRAEYERWARTVPDFGLIPETEYLASIWPDGVQPVTTPPVPRWVDSALQLSSPTEGASIGYQILRGDEVPGSSWSVYVGPLAVQAGERVIAVADRIGYRPSATVSVDGRVER